MSLIGQWCECADSMVRCLTAVAPETGDLAFGQMLDLVAGHDSPSDSGNHEGEWFRSAEGERDGYIFIGPEGRDHHFQADPPEGIDPASIKRMPPAPAGRLWREIEAFLDEARTLAAGGASSVRSATGPIGLRCEEADLPRVHTTLSMLEGALALRRPVYGADLLRRSSQAFLANIAGGVPAALQAATEEILALRARYLADADVWAVAMLRQEAMTRLGANGSPPSLVFKLYDVSGVLSNPYEAMRQTVSDFATAQHAEVVMAICDAALNRAETAVQSALDAQSVRGHQDSLYEAAAQAYAAMRIGEVLRDQVAPKYWPKDITHTLLCGYASQTEEIVVRAGQALAVACINLGSGAASRRHEALVAAQGVAKADELIEDYWYYPRAARATLLQAVSGSQVASLPSS